MRSERWRCSSRYLGTTIPSNPHYSVAVRCVDIVEMEEYQVSYHHSIIIYNRLPDMNN